MNPKTNKLTLNLGSTPAEQQQTLNDLKHAMATAIFAAVENGTHNPQSFQIYQLIYFEANHKQSLLNG